MTPTTYKNLYTKSLSGLNSNIHFMAHSHHLWPDSAFEGHLECINDAYKYNDSKWDKIFSEIIPDCKKIICRNLGINYTDSIVFAPNTHELVYRLFTTLPKKAKILTSTNEFYSFARQAERLVETGDIVLSKLSLNTAENEIIFFEHLLKNSYDLIYLSQVFFNTGKVLSNDFIESILDIIPEKTKLVIDGYHGFCAIPNFVDKFQKNLFYVAGGYKYAQAGEGVCFMITPTAIDLYPKNTGWFASFHELSKKSSTQIKFAKGADALWGATFDPSGLYRMRSLWNSFQKHNISVDTIHKHVQKLQEKLNTYQIKHAQLIQNEIQGHFLVYDFSNESDCQKHVQHLKEKNILVDLRGARLRIGLGLYHDELDLNVLF